MIKKIINWFKQPSKKEYEKLLEEKNNEILKQFKDNMKLWDKIHEPDFEKAALMLEVKELKRKNKEIIDFIDSCIDETSPFFINNEQSIENPNYIRLEPIQCDTDENYSYAEITADLTLFKSSEPKLWESYRENNNFNIDLEKWKEIKYNNIDVKFKENK